MELLIMDENFAGVSTLDIFESLIWTDRYYACGDFEIYMPCSEKMLSTLKQDMYLYLRESEHIMIIEDIQIDTDVEDGAHLTVTGRSLESILDRRVIWNLTTLSGGLQAGIKQLLNENAISPSDPARVIPNLIFKDSTDSKITNLALNAQYYGENLYDVICEVCESNEIGFKITLNESNQMVFALYAGTDRSYEQTENPYVIFSPGFDNLLNSNYISSKKTLKTVTMITGEGEGSDKKKAVAECSNGAGSGLNRREMHTDASGISQTDGENTISDEDYTALLQRQGIDELSQNTRTESFEGEVSSGRTYTYGTDYFMGDIVQNVNEFNIKATSRVTEYIMSQDESGIERYPTFTSRPYVGLPDGYTQLQYIESHGTEYIDTGFKPNQNTRVICDMEFLTNPVNNDFFGARSEDEEGMATLPDEFSTWFDAINNRFKDSYGSSKSVDISVDYLGRHTIDKNKNVTSVDSTSITHDAQTFSTPYTMYIFCTNSEGAPFKETNTIGRLYSFRIYSSSEDGNDLLIRNFIPVKNPDGEYGLYDLVDGKFYSNAGTGAFTGA